MSKTSPKNAWPRAGKAIFAGLGLLVVVTLVLVSSRGDSEKEREQRAELERLREEAQRLNDEGHALADQLDALSRSVGWRSRSYEDEASQPGDPMLARIVDGARISFAGPDSSAWKELDALSDEELIAEVRSLRDQFEQRRRAGRGQPLPSLVQRLEMATSLMDDRGLEH